MKYLILFVSLMMMSCNNSKNINTSTKDMNIVGNYKVIFMAEMVDLDVASKNITINFNADGKLNGNNSCNNYGGDYKKDKNKLSFGMMMSTRKFCRENAKIETAFMRNLTEADSYKIEDDVLILLQGNTQKIKAKKVSKTE